MKKMLKAPFVRRITKKLSEEEQHEIDSAQMPALSAITPEQLAKFRGGNNQNVKVMLQGIGLFAVLLIPGFLSKSYEFCAAIIATTVIFAAAAFVIHLKSNIDDSAGVSVIPVHHTERTFTGDKAVVYLPDGKYRIPVSRKFPFEPGSVTVVTCGKITLLDFNKKEIRKDDSE